MNKKMLSLFFTSTLVLGACGVDNTDTEDQERADNNVEVVSEDTDNETDDSESNEDKVSDIYFDDGDFEYKIKEIEQIKGKNDTAILAVEYEFTNNTDDAEAPWLAGGFVAYQEIKDTVEMLDNAIGMFPEDYKPDSIEMFDTDIKPGKTVDVVQTFELKYPGSKVILKDFGIEEGELFEKIVDTQE